jgi:hypothetical protein
MECGGDRSEPAAPSTHPAPGSGDRPASHDVPAEAERITLSARLVEQSSGA